MKIILNNVIPNPLKEDNLELSKVWNTSLHITNDDHYFLSSNSGKGKSTFLNYLYGLRNDYEGSILINDEDISKFSLQDWSNLRKGKIAYLPQNLQLINHLSIWDNLLLKNNLTNRYSEGQIKTFLTQFNLLTHINRPVGKLSIGQQQRVALIRTLLQPFNILLLDEPFSHLDEENIIIGLDLINEACKKENANYIIATLGYSYGIESNKTLLL